ncbi:MAG: TIGR00725 family protein [Proteobacteria bacterium]|nr:MAG: TIGR00725 family protein [Pseudomonadota bacterium]
MTDAYFLDRGRSRLYRRDGRVFDGWAWQWRPGDGPPPPDGVAVDAATAIKALRHNGKLRGVPVGVIGPREATAAQLRCAQAVGSEIAALGAPMICGGRSGVMEAAAKGAYEASGTTIGLLPDSEWREANEYIVIPIATGLGEARNMIIAKSCVVLVAVGNSYGTLTEVGFALHFGKPVIGLEDPPKVEGVWEAASVGEALVRLAELLLESAVAA